MKQKTRWPSVNGVGEVFLQMIPHFKSYEMYASNCSIAFRSSTNCSKLVPSLHHTATTTQRAKRKQTDSLDAMNVAKIPTVSQRDEGKADG